MEDHRLRYGADLVTGQLQAPAEVDFFKVHEEVEIEEADLAGGGDAEEERRATSPKERYRRVVLAFVALAAVEETADGVRVEATDGRHDSDMAVVATGVWMGRLIQVCVGGMRKPL